MTLPSVAIVGRPNVGKSSLLNFLAGRRIAIVDPTAGVTRDRLAALVEHDWGRFELIDTGGYGVGDKAGLTVEIQTQIQRAIEAAALILFVIDARRGPLPLDHAVAAMLRRFNKPVLLVANKLDSPALDPLCVDLFALGFGEPLPVSCLQHRGRDPLLKSILEKLGAASTEPPPPAPELKLAVIGKRNAGKSTLVNTLVGQPRVIVSPLPGTTRDSVDVRLEFDQRTVLIIDTAGVRKRSRMTADDLEFYSLHRAQRSIRRADVVLLLIDATLEIGDVDQKLAAYVAAQFKPVIFGINKWDLVGPRANAADYAAYIAQCFPQLEFAPVACMSATIGTNLAETMRLALALHNQAGTRLGTAPLNQVVEGILKLRGPGSRSAAPVKAYYATQIGVHPPTFVLFVNQPKLVSAEYRRFFLRQLRQRTVLAQIPIRLLVRGHHGARRSRQSQESTDSPRAAPPQPKYIAPGPHRGGVVQSPRRPSADRGPGVDSPLETGDSPRAKIFASREETGGL